ncbi:hypothetical protein Tco_0886700 [Tanacetum coccineum]
MEMLETENVSLEFKVQSLMKEHENIKLEYHKLFDSIKKTRIQTQGEINELIENVNQKTDAYGDVRAKNQDILITISELKAKLKNVEKGKSVNTKFDKPLVSSKLLCVTSINKQVIQKKKFVLKTEEKHVLTKPVTLQTSPTKKKNVDKNTKVIAPRMYKMSAKDKAELGYGNQMNKSVLSYEKEVFQSVFVSRTSNIEDSPVNDRYAEGMHVVPPPMTGIYIPSRPDKEYSMLLHNSKYHCEETHESMPEPVVNESKVVSEPKVWSDAPIIEEYESYSEDEHVSLPTKEQKTPSFAFINIVKGFFSHFIKDCDYYEKKMAKQAKLTNRVVKRTGQVIEKPVWNNAWRVNHENKFVPRTVLINTGRSSVNTARQKVNTHAEPASTAKKIGTARPKHWLVQKQTVFVKDKSIPLMVDSLPKTVWVINAPCYCNKALTSLVQTAIGKDTSNPLMAGSLPKTAKPT